MGAFAARSLHPTRSRRRDAARHAESVLACCLHVAVGLKSLSRKSFLSEVTNLG